MNLLDCSLCGTKFMRRADLKRHMKNKHKVEFNIKPPNYKCLEDGCQHAFHANQQLVEHLESVHMKIFEVVHMSFDNKQEFDAWMTELQQTTNVSYRNRGKGGNNASYCYYYCHRSNDGTFKPRNDASFDRPMKSKGSCKLPHKCTSQIKVEFQNERLNVIWVKTHFGHEEEIQHNHLSDVDRRSIARDLLIGVTPDRIIENYTNTHDGQTMRRINLLTKQDIRNISNSFRVKIKRKRDHTEIFKSTPQRSKVEQWRFLADRIAKIDPSELDPDVLNESIKYMKIISNLLSSVAN